MTHDTFIDEVADRGAAINEFSDLVPLIEKIKGKKVVMLGESSHGTREYYEFRNYISKELVEKHGFNFIVVEGDWPPCQEVNRFARGESHLDVASTLERFSRWPTWMWANSSVMGMINWLRDFNEKKEGTPVGFHGLDVYSLYESIDEVLKMFPELTDIYSCFEPYRHDEMEYARSLVRLSEGCERDAIKALRELLHRNIQDPDRYLDATQNARVVINAEKYYRAMVFSQGDDSWNVRDRHMMDTLEMLLEHYGPDAKAIVWAHNTHIGDYRGTDMVLHHQVNIGGLSRERLGEDKVALVGFSTHRGSVIASNAWDGPIQVFTVPEALEGSLEDLLKEAVPRIGSMDYYFMCDDIEKNSPLNEYLGHRAIGVVYSPYLERRGNYVPTKVAQRYDAMIFLEVTNALVPMDIGFDHAKFPETYPFGARI